MAGDASSFSAASSGPPGGLPPGGLSDGLVFLVVAIAGTTIAPWRLFFQQSRIADKRLRFTDPRAARFDTAVAAATIATFAACMMVIGDAMYRGGDIMTIRH